MLLEIHKKMSHDYIGIIKKRDGTQQKFEICKAMKGVNIAFQNVLNSRTEEINSKNQIETIENFVLKKIKQSSQEQEPLGIDFIQDTIESALMHLAPSEVAKHYILYRKLRDENRTKADTYYDVQKIEDDIEVPWGPLGYVTFKRTYARKKNDNETESFRDTILRVLKACQTQLKADFTVQELKQYYKYMMQLKGTVSGRFLWQLGTTTVDRLGLMSLQNCAFVRIDECIEPFCFVFDTLMLGVGCGVSVQNKNIAKLPKVLMTPSPISVTRRDTKDADFIIPDSREGILVLTCFLATKILI